MSWIERSVEERLANAATGGELDTPELNGTALDLDTPRGEGWWADQFTRRELSHDRRNTALAAVAVVRAGFWRSTTLEVLRERVLEANAAIAHVNINLIESDRLAPFDAIDIEDRWRTLRAR